MSPVTTPRFSCPSVEPSAGRSDGPCVDARQHAADCAAHYEALRAQIMGVATPALVHGVSLGLLLQQGVPAWVQALRTVMHQSPPPSRPMAGCPDTAPRAEVIPATQYGDVVTLLAGLVLSARPPRHEPARCPGGSV